MIYISIILPTFNRGYILKDCIDTIIDQTYNYWELIILDDCSIDNTEEIGNNYQNLHTNIRYIKNTIKLFQQGNKNKGITLAKYPYIFIMEDDVFLEKNCLEILANTYETLIHDNKKIGAVAPRLINSGEKIDLHDSRPFIINKVTGEIWNNYSIKIDQPTQTDTLHACSLFAKMAYTDAGGFSEGRYIGNCYREETDLYYKMRQKGYSLYFIPDACALHKSGSIGGCKIRNPIKLHYYNIRNHCVFLMHFYSYRVITMIPCYIIQYIYHHFYMKWIIDRRDGK